MAPPIIALQVNDYEQRRGMFAHLLNVGMPNGPVFRGQQILDEAEQLRQRPGVIFTLPNEVPQQQTTDPSLPKQYVQLGFEHIHVEGLDDLQDVFVTLETEKEIDIRLLLSRGSLDLHLDREKKTAELRGTETLVASSLGKSLGADKMEEFTLPKIRSQY